MKCNLLNMRQAFLGNFVTKKEDLHNKQLSIFLI